MTDEDPFRVRKWIEKRRDLRRLAQYQNTPGLLLPRPEPHYHLLYNAIPDVRIGYETTGLAMRRLKEIADKHEEKSGEVTYYEDMEIIQLVEANIRGRTGKFNIMVQIGQCHSRKCTNIIKIVTVEDKQ